MSPCLNSMSPCLNNSTETTPGTDTAIVRTTVEVDAETTIGNAMIDETTLEIGAIDATNITTENNPTTSGRDPMSGTDTVVAALKTATTIKDHGVACIHRSMRNSGKAYIETNII